MGDRSMLAIGQRASSLSAQPVFGAPVTVPPSSAARGLLLCFVGSLATRTARRTLSTLQELVPDAQTARVGLAAVTSSSVLFARDYVPRYHLLPPLVADPGGLVHTDFFLDVGGHRGRRFTDADPTGWLESLTLGEWPRCGGPLVAFALDAEGEIRGLTKDIAPSQLRELLACVAS
jgi:hypothetical protein